MISTHHYNFIINFTIVPNLEPVSSHVIRNDAEGQVGDLLEFLIFWLLFIFLLGFQKSFLFLVKLLTLNHATFC